MELEMQLQPVSKHESVALLDMQKHGESKDDDSIKRRNKEYERSSENGGRNNRSDKR